MRMRRAVIDLFATEVGKDVLEVSRVLSNQVIHQRERTGHALLVGVVEREAHAEHVASNEALARILAQGLWILVTV